MLHLLGGLDRPSGGEVSLNGRRIDDIGEKALARLRRTDVGFVFQAFHLMEELTAIENVELSALLEQVGLADRARFLPSALSGGQRQRVAIALALSNEPLLVLADEPTGNLDSVATLDVLRLFESLHESGQTLVIVTHDARIAATADWLISMRDGAFVDETKLDRWHHRAARCPCRAGGLRAMGRILLVGRLAVRDLPRRRIEAALLLLAIMAATTTLTRGLLDARNAGRRTINQPGGCHATCGWSPSSPPFFCPRAAFGGTLRNLGSAVG